MADAFCLEAASGEESRLDAFAAFHERGEAWLIAPTIPHSYLA
jgi:hypothetical protein